MYCRGMLSALLLIGVQPDATLTRIKAEAASMRVVCQTPVAAEFLKGADDLTAPAPRPIYYREKDRQLSSVPGEGFEPTPLTSALYYDTKYGTPLAYARVIEAAGRHGFKTLKGKRVLDIGYGTVGHLRLMALAGAGAVGVDVDPFLVQLYSHSSDQGAFGAGKVQMVDGSWPEDAKVAKSVGKDFDLITSKNTLKRGYVHPERKVDPRMLVDLGVSDEKYLAAVHSALRPGGYFVVYNLSPPQNPDPEKWIPWSDGRCAFTRDQLTKAGFRVLEYDQTEDQVVARMAVAFGWAKSTAEARAGFYSHVTVCRRR